MVGDFNIPFSVTGRTNRIEKTWVSFNLFGKVRLFINFILNLTELPFWVFFDLIEVFFMTAILNSLSWITIFHDFEFGFWRTVIFIPCYHVTLVVHSALLLCWSIWSSEHRSGDGSQCLDDLDGGYLHCVQVTWVMGHHIVVVGVTCEEGGWVSELTRLFNCSLWLLALLCCSWEAIETSLLLPDCA